MDEYARLLAYQQQLEKEADDKITFFGLSINETIRTCLVNGMSKKADKLKADFKVPDKRSASISPPLFCSLTAFQPGSGTSNCML
jgi:Vps16, C-terminal region